MIQSSARTPGRGIQRGSPPTTEAAEAHASTVVRHNVNVVGRELGNLSRLRNDAAQQGEVVTRSDLKLAYDMVGSMPVVRDARTEFASRSPAPVVPQIVARQIQEEAERHEREAETPSAARAVSEVRQHSEQALARIDAKLAKPRPPTGDEATAAEGPLDTSA